MNLPSAVSNRENPGRMLPLVYVVDDHEEMCASIEALLSGQGYSVECFTEPIDFIDKLGQLHSGLVLLDLRMPTMSGLEVLHAMRGCLMEFPVIMMTGHGEIEDAVKAIKAGARDFLPKPFKSENLIDTLKREGEILSERVANEIDRPTIDDLSPRERDVVLALAKGQPNKVIANNLGISVRTVEMHRSRAMTRLRCKTFADLLRVILRDPRSL